MAATNLRELSPAKLLTFAANQAPNITLQPGDAFYWSPANATIGYATDQLHTVEGQYSLLHELGHALSKHRSYSTDMSLMLLETEAWQVAQSLAADLGLEIDDSHIQDCLDTYRDWLHRRSMCPSCATVSLQRENGPYRCHNCFSEWTVSDARFCRPYRKKKLQEKSPVQITRATFQ